MIIHLPTKPNNTFTIGHNVLWFSKAKRAYRVHWYTYLINSLFHTSITRFRANLDHKWDSKQRKCEISINGNILLQY